MGNCKIDLNLKPEFLFSFFKDVNPLYRQATVKYQNPTYRGYKVAAALDSNQ
jgi:Integrin beta cytoplasmic domain